MIEKSKVVIIGGSPDSVHSILKAINNADFDLVTLVKDEKSLHAELSEAIFVDSLLEQGDQLSACPVGEYAQRESICDPLQEAINSTEAACRSAQGLILSMLQSHLGRLLDLQYHQINGDDKEELVLMTIIKSCSYDAPHVEHFIVDSLAKGQTLALYRVEGKEK